EGVHLARSPLQDEARLESRQVYIAQRHRGAEQTAVDDELAALAVGQQLDLPVTGERDIEHETVGRAGIDLDVEAGIEGVAAAGVEVALQSIAGEGSELEPARLSEAGGGGQDEEGEGEERSAHGVSLVVPHGFYHETAALPVLRSAPWVLFPPRRAGCRKHGLCG